VPCVAGNDPSNFPALKCRQAHLGREFGSITSLECRRHATADADAAAAATLVSKSTYLFRARIPNVYSWPNPASCPAFL